MKTLLVQDYLKSGKTLEDLKVEHGVYHYKCNDKISLTYDMIEAKEADLLAQECRGLILEENTYNIIAVPLFRFFNLEQKEYIPKNFDWSSAVYENKADGSLIITYFYKNNWFCATRSRPEADGNIDGGDLTFAKLVNFTIQDQFKLPDLNALMASFPEEAKDYTFCFELTSPFNRIVCRYDQPRLTLLAVRHNLNLNEVSPEEWVRHRPGLETPLKFNFKSTNDMVEAIRSWNPEEYEGVVVKDKHFNRIKVKNPSYVAFNKLRDSLSTSYRGCLEIILLEKDDDVIGMLPDLIKERLIDIKEKFQILYKETLSDYNRLKNIENMKEYAVEVQKCRWQAVLFALKRNRVKDIKEFYLKTINNSSISNSTLDSILNILGYK